MTDFPMPDPGMPTRYPFSSRAEDLGSVILNEEIDAIHEVLNKLRGVERDRERAEVNLYFRAFNNSEAVVLSPGQLWGIDSDGKVALAYGAATGHVRAGGVVVKSPASPGQEFLFALIGPTDIQLESESIVPSRGDAAWASVTKRGTVTSVQPSDGRRQLLGQFLGERDDSGLAEVNLLIDLGTSR